MEAGGAEQDASDTMINGVARQVIIDGSILEGGGQILRNSAALAAITGTHLQVDRIRAGRAKPGLKTQHLTGLQLITTMCSGHLEGGAVGSNSISLRPALLYCGKYTADTKTAGSCTLMAQAALPCLLYARPSPGQLYSELDLRGGTDADMAPPASYLTDILAPQLRHLFGLDLEERIVRRGFFPRGGGLLHLRLRCLELDQALPAVDLTQRGQIKQITIQTFAAGKAPLATAQRMATSAQAELRKALGRGVPIQQEVVQETSETAMGDGSGILIKAETDTGCVFGATAKAERGVTPDAVATIASQEMMEVLQSGACVDQWMQDQLIIFLALAAGTSRMCCGELTLHTRTAMVVAEQMLPGVKFTIKSLPAAGGGVQGAAGAGLHLVECQGIGLTQQELLGKRGA